jgi:flagellin-like protein
MSGIEPIIAVVILVAITLVIAIGAIGWLMGW